MCGQETKAVELAFHMGPHPQFLNVLSDDDILLTQVDWELTAVYEQFKEAGCDVRWVIPEGMSNAVMFIAILAADQNTGVSAILSATAVSDITLATKYLKMLLSGSSQWYAGRRFYEH